MDITNQSVTATLADATAVIKSYSEVAPSKAREKGTMAQCLQDCPNPTPADIAKILSLQGVFLNNFAADIMKGANLLKNRRGSEALGRDTAVSSAFKAIELSHRAFDRATTIMGKEKNNGRF